MCHFKLVRTAASSLLALCRFAAAVLVDANPNPSNSSDDPVLQYRPAFTRSMPVQILLTGIIFTLAAILLIQLLFTARYHWQLSPGNYVLQVTGVISLGSSLVASMYKILTVTAEESQEWPYMLSYIAVDIPPLHNRGSWAAAELTGWLVMNGIISALIQMVHVHFLTLLFPSKLVKNLIFILLVPPTILHGVVQVLPVWTNPTIVSMSHYLANICSATLALLFTLMLLYWAFISNRKNAWRTEGGTAAFGVAAMLLSIIMTIMTFVYIPTKDQYEWYPELVHAIMMWQSYLGWWWWAGSRAPYLVNGFAEPKSKKGGPRATRAAQPLKKGNGRPIRTSTVGFLGRLDHSLRRRTNAGDGGVASLLMREVKLKPE